MQVIDTAASDSTLWIKSAFKLFAAQPLGWIGLTAIWFLLNLVLMMLPIVGPIFLQLLRPAMHAGFMLACRDQEAGKPVMPSHLFAAFRAGPVLMRPLLMFGAIGLVIAAIVSIGLVAIGFPSMPQEAIKSPEALVVFLQSLADKSLVFIVWFVIAVVETAIFWFVTPLLAFKPMPVSHAIRWSFFAFLSNVAPMLLFGLVMFLLLIIASIPLALGMIVWMPLSAIANYTSYQRVFRE